MNRTIPANEPMVYQRDDIADLYEEPIYVYSCRAECQSDVMTFIASLFNQSIRVMHVMIMPDVKYPDALLEFGLKENGDHMVIDILRKQGDSHVMRETMKRCPLKENGYSRTYGPGLLEMEVDGKIS